jgi:hypothetical protein
VKPIINLRALVLVAAVAASACSGGPPEGSVDGTFGGQTLDAQIDSSSEFYLRRKTSCTTKDQSIFHLSYGGGTLNVDFQLDGGPSIFADRDYTLPTTGAPLVSFTVTPSTPELVSGSLTAAITGLLGRRTGWFDLTFADGGSLTATFDLPFDARGERIDCGGSSGDDWD